MAGEDYDTMSIITQTLSVAAAAQDRALWEAVARGNAQVFAPNGQAKLLEPFGLVDGLWDFRTVGDWRGDAAPNGFLGTELLTVHRKAAPDEGGGILADANGANTMSDDTEIMPGLDPVGDAQLEGRREWECDTTGTRDTEAIKALRRFAEGEPARPAVTLRIWLRDLLTAFDNLVTDDINTQYELDARRNILQRAVDAKQRIYPDELGNGWMDSIDRLAKGAKEGETLRAQLAAEIARRERAEAALADLAATPCTSKTDWTLAKFIRRAQALVSERDSMAESK